MEYRFLRFHYQIMCVFWGLIGFDVLFTLLGITNLEATLSMLPVVVLVPIAFLGILCFYPIAQTVHIDAKGIRIYFFKKTLREVTWKQIVNVETYRYHRGPIYLFTVRDTGGLNYKTEEFILDRRKKIKVAILGYCTDDIREAMSKLPPEV